MGTGGDDTLNGGDDKNYLYGDSDTGDVTTGGNDTLNGGAGDDLLNGGKGDDDLYGDSDSGVVATGGSDTFVFDTATDFGADTVFDPGAGTIAAEDTAQFDNVGGTGTLADLEAVSTTTDDGTDVTVTMDDDGASVTFKGLGTVGNTIDTIVELDATTELAVHANA